MATVVGELQPTLAHAGRLPRLSNSARWSAAEWAALGICGFLAACTEAFIHLDLKLPGHAILRAILPLMCGMALVPRRGAGSAMGFFAGCGAILLNRLPGEGISLASGIALTLIGPAIDLALLTAKPESRLYWRFALAGVLANIAALSIRVFAVSLGLHIQKEPLATYLTRAVPSYILCGALAGLIGGAVCFRRRATGHEGTEP